MADSPVYIAKATVAASELNGGAVLLDLDRSRYFGLNQVGELVWQQLSTQKTLYQLCDEVCRVFEVPKEVCVVDIEQLLNQLLERELIERHDALVS